MVRLRMAENLKEAVTFIEQGHIRVGYGDCHRPGVPCDEGHGGRGDVGGYVQDQEEAATVQ